MSSRPPVPPVYEYAVSVSPVERGTSNWWRWVVRVKELSGTPLQCTIRSCGWWYRNRPSDKEVAKALVRGMRKLRREARAEAALATAAGGAP